MVLGAFVAGMGILIAISMARLIIDGGGDWLGPEPEMLIPIAAVLVAAFLFWLGVHFWRQRQRG